MGFFSWFTSDTKERIAFEKTSNLYMKGQDGRVFHMAGTYQGFGNFGGKDFYSYVAELNRPDDCIGDDDEDRSIGISIYCRENRSGSDWVLDKAVRLPRIFAKAENLNRPIDDFPPAVTDPMQGFFYPETDPVCAGCGYPESGCQCKAKGFA